MSNKKIILLNGGPNFGKDYIGRYLITKLKDARLDKFARVLKERTHALYGYPSRNYLYYEDCKDIPNKDFLGLTPREAYIQVSESYFKPIHGKDIFGILLSNELDKFSQEINIITDSGFKSEAEVLIEKYNRKNILLIKLKVEHIKINYEDGVFPNDSRSYILLDNVTTKFIDNDFTDKTLVKIEKVIKEWISYIST